MVLRGNVGASILNATLGSCGSSEVRFRGVSEKEPQMLRAPSTALLTLLLVACNSGNSLDGQIEKCVQAGLKANEPYKSAQDRAEEELGLRGWCLRQASGKG